MKSKYAEDVPDMLSPEDHIGPRSVEMEQLYPGTKFVPWFPTKEEKLIAERDDLIVLTYPRAIMLYENLPGEYSSKKTRAILAAFDVAYDRMIGYVTFTTLKFLTGYSFDELFLAIRGMYYEDWGVIRLGMDEHEGKWWYTKFHKLCNWEDRNDEKWKNLHPPNV